MTEDEEETVTPEALRFYFGDRRRADDHAALEAFVEGLADREWLVGPPVLVEFASDEDLRAVLETVLRS